MEGPRSWFGGWIKYHQALNPHKEWRRYQSPGFNLIYKPWVRAFRLRGVTLEDARAASEQMAAEESRYPEKHLARLIKVTGRVKERREARSRAEADAARAEARKREDRRQDRIKELWKCVPEEVKETYREWTRNNHPQLSQFEKFVELSSRNRWAELAQPQKNQTIGA